ncbi:acetyl-CoA synthetase-like protein, partial [Ramicandelaber brevisporus]
MTIFRSRYADQPIPLVDIPTFIFSTARQTSSYRTRPSAKIFVDVSTGYGLTLDELETRCRQFASGLVRNLGFSNGDTLMFVSPNSIEYPVVVIGTMMAGGTCSLANPAYTPNELAYQMKDCGAKFLVATPDTVANVVAAAKQLGIPASRMVVVGGGNGSDNVKVEAAAKEHGARSIGSTLSSHLIEPVKVVGEAAKTRVALLCYSSGTTGLSKGVMTTHYNMVSNIIQCTALVELDPVPQIVRQEEIVSLSVLPYYHIYGLHTQLLWSVTKAQTTVVMSKFDLVAFLEAIQRYRVTDGSLVPPIILALAKHPIVDKYDTSSFKFVMSGAAKLGPDLSEEFSKRLNLVVCQGWGLTETSPVATRNPNDGGIPGSVGILLPNVEMKVIDDEGKAVGVGQTGELLVRGPNIMHGYHNNVKATEECIDKERWFYTGDIGHIDENGYVFITDRRKSLIKYKGFQVSPAELEGLLLTHPLIADCAVIGVEDDAQAT